MAISDRLKSIAEMTGPVDSPRIKGVASDSDLQKLLETLPKTKSSPRTGDGFFIRPESGGDDFRIPDRFLIKPESGGDDFRVPDKFFIRPKEGSVTAREVEVAGEFEDMLMKMYDEAVEQGYKGSFFDFLIDRMDEEFDPASPMRVSRLPKGIMQLMNMMQNKRTT